MTSNRVKERIGINRVSTIVETRWACGWQEYAAQNDDAIDGVILMRRGLDKPADTGGIVFAQVKCGGNGYRKDQAQYPDHIGVQLGKAYIDKHRPRWNRVPGPVVLVFVDDTSSKDLPPAWWVDLRDEGAYSPTNEGMILVPKIQVFSHHTKGDFRRLCGVGVKDRDLAKLELERCDVLVPKLGRTESVRNDAWEYYKRWRSSKEDRTNPVLGEILVNRVGWKHISRRGRLPERILQSWQLLGAAKEIVKKSNRVFELGRAKTRHLPEGKVEVSDYLGLRAVVVFPHRHESVIHVVLKRSRLLNVENAKPERQKIWFYSVYELRRGISSR